MHGAMPPLSHYAFMPWCRVKAQGELYLYFTTVFYSVMALCSALKKEIHDSCAACYSSPVIDALSNAAVI
jgi:hypothetical protein